MNIEPDEWLVNGLPLLRVIAAYPDSIGKLDAPCVSLKMEVFAETIDEECILASVAASLRVKRRREESEDGGSASKRRC